MYAAARSTWTSSEAPPRRWWRGALVTLATVGSFLVPTLRGPAASANPPTLVPNGAPTDVVFSTGQTSKTYAYQATAGQYLTLDIANGSWSSEIDAELKLYDPDDNFVIYTYFGHTGWTGEVGPLLAGTYTFDLTATSESTPESAEFYFATDQTGVLPTNTTTFQFATQEPGQYARYQFNATAGQTFTMNSTGDFAAECDVTMYLFNPSGTNEQYSCTGSSGYFDYAIPTSGTWTMYIVNPEIESGTVILNATLNPEPGAFGYVWANEPTSTKYKPEKVYSKNSTGAHNSVVRNGVGNYVVTFPGLAGASANGGTVDVTGYETSGYCKAAGWRTIGTAVALNVVCFAPGGDADDAEFDALFAASGSSAPADLSYLWANEPTQTSYTPSTIYQFNGGAGADTVARNGTGEYTVSIPDIGVNAGTVKVTGYNDDPTNCDVQGWGGSPTLEVSVFCNDSSGGAADAYFSMTWANDTSLLGTAGGKWGYVWANEPTAASYTPDPTYQASSGNHAVNTVSRSGVGSYTVDFPTLSGKKGDVQVTAYDTTDVCNTSGWGSDGAGGAVVSVNCYNTAGTPADSYFTAQYIA